MAAAKSLEIRRKMLLNKKESTLPKHKEEASSYSEYKCGEFVVMFETKQQTADRWTSPERRPSDGDDKGSTTTIDASKF